MAEASDEAMERARQRLLALIHPNVAVTEAQRQAFESAAALQAAWEAENGEFLDAARRGVQRFSAGDYSETYFAHGAGGDCGEICPDARAALFNAGLLRRSWPCARRM